MVGVAERRLAAGALSSALTGALCAARLISMNTAGDAVALVGSGADGKNGRVSEHAKTPCEGAPVIKFINANARLLGINLPCKPTQCVRCGVRQSLLP